MRFFEGRQPRFTQVPPRVRDSVITAVLPSSAALSAAAKAVEPEPRMTRSNLSGLLLMCFHSCVVAHACSSGFLDTLTYRERFRKGGSEGSSRTRRAPGVSDEPARHAREGERGRSPREGGRDRGARELLPRARRSDSP